MAKYDTIGKNYNNTRKPDPVLVSRLAQHVAPTPQAKYLDVGCGTGNYTCELAAIAGDWTGVDPSKEMLNKASAKCEGVDWVQGNAESFTLPTKSFDKCVCTLTLHHWSDLAAGFKNIHEHLRDSGRLIIFTSTPKQMRSYWLNHYFPVMLADSMNQMPSFDLVSKSLNEAGFRLELQEPYSIHPEIEDLFLYAGKHDPEMYFNEKIRKGISSFSSLAHRQEVESGLRRLRQDLDSGKFAEIRQRYTDKHGDYVYLVCSKK